MSADFQHPPPSGVEQTGVIDLLMHDREKDEVTLVMLERRPWDGSPRRLFELQEKLNAYLSFALDGEMAEAYPQLAGKPLRLRLDSLTPPDPKAAAMLAIVADQIAFQGISLEVRIERESGCGSGCACHGPGQGAA